MKKTVAYIASIVVFLLASYFIYQNINSNPLTVTGFILIDSEKNEPVKDFNPIKNGAKINLTYIDAPTINIQAKTNPEEVGSVVFLLNDTTINTENESPYSLVGDYPSGNYLDWVPIKGWYNLTAIPYTEKDGEGEKGKRLSVLIEITEKNIIKTPLQGQIIVDPENPAWLKRNNAGSFFLCGPGDPEEFLYRGTRNPDGTRNGDQIELINKLIGTGANSIYLQAIRSHGGDGEPTHNPFVDSDPEKGLDNDILDQWEEWFNEMDKNDIIIFFFFYDDGAIVWDTGDDVSEEERNYINIIVDRFQHHKNLIWVITEEFQDRYSVERLSKIAAEIRIADNHNHVISVHHSPEQEMAFPDDPNIDQYAIQYYDPLGDRDEYTREELHEKVVRAWEIAEGRYNLNMAEADKWGNGEKARKKNWAVAMAGAYVMILGMDIENTPINDLEDCGRLVEFMENTSFASMAPHDELAYGGTEYVLANPGISYIVYASSLNGHIGIQNMSEGTYNLSWYDIPTGTTIKQERITVQDGDQTWEKPETIGKELALYITIIKRAPEKINFPKVSWQYKPPEMLGLNSNQLDNIQELIGGSGLIIKDGYIVKSWGNQDYVHYWASTSKPVISTLLFYAIEEGKIESVDSLVGDWGWEFSQKDQSMTFRHLANMVSGYARPEAPGENYAYNDRAIQLYFLTMERVFKQSINDAAMQRLHTQLQLEGTHIFSERGKVLLSLPDFARICWFWVNKGNWDGDQILPEFYFDQYMRPGVPMDLPYAPFDHFVDDYLGIGTYGAEDTSRENLPGPGIYGFNWWFNAPGTLIDGTEFDLPWPDAPTDAFMSRGKGDAHSLMIPSLGIIMVSADSDWGPTVQITTELNSTNSVLKTLLESFIKGP